MLKSLIQLNNRHILTESGTHKFIKEKIAEALSELGYDTKTEHRVKDGRLDVYAKKGKNEVKVEVIKTHIPEWILAEITGEILEKEPSTRKSHMNKGIMGIFYKGFALGIIQRDGTIICMPCICESREQCTQSYRDPIFYEHLQDEHMPPNLETFSKLQFRDKNNK